MMKRMTTTSAANRAAKLSARRFAAAVVTGALLIGYAQQVKGDSLVYDFNDGLQGWEQRWPSPGGSVSLWNEATVVSSTYRALGTAGDNDETMFGRSPEFNLNQPGEDLICGLVGGASRIPDPCPPSQVPEASIHEAGFAGVALRDVASDTYVLWKRKTTSAYNAVETVRFTAAELAGFVNDGNWYTLDFIDYNKGGWGWARLDSAIIPGSLAPPPPNAKIIGFDFGLYGPGTIDGTTISLTMPDSGVDVTALAPAYTLSTGATCIPISGSAQDFSNPVSYTVISSDLLITNVYVVTVTVPPPDAKITGFDFGEPLGQGIIDGTTISLTVPGGTDVTALEPTYTLSIGATCNLASGSAQDFSLPVSYTVISSDLLITNVYVVTVIVPPDLSTTLVGHWVAGAENLDDISGYLPGTHNGRAAGPNAALLAFNEDVPQGFGGYSLDLTAGDVAVIISNSATGEGAGYVNTFDEGINTQFTVAFWAKGMPGSWSPWVSKDGEGVGWQIRQNSSSGNACFTMRGLLNHDGTGSSRNVNDGAWHHFVGVWDQAASNRTLYVDGAFSHVVKNTPGQTMSSAAARRLILGARSVGNSDTDITHYFSGLLYDVRIYNQALFAEQIETIMTTPATPPTPQARFLSFELFGTPATIAGTRITLTVPLAADPAALAPTFTLSEGATCDRASGSTIDLSSPVHYTVISEDGLRTNVYTVSLAPSTLDAFNDGTLQGWHNRVWDLAANSGAGGWVDLEPDVSVMPGTINNGVLQPQAAANSLFIPKDGAVAVNSGDAVLNTMWLRSPEFYLTTGADLTVQLAGGLAKTDAPANDREVPWAAILDGGWKGVALRRVRDGVFVLAKSRIGNGALTFATITFTQAELEPYVGRDAYTLDLIDADRTNWGFIYMDNVSVPRTFTPAKAGTVIMLQ